jgi:hypothetical protein
MCHPPVGPVGLGNGGQYRKPLVLLVWTAQQAVLGTSSAGDSWRPLCSLNSPVRIC